MRSSLPLALLHACSAPADEPVPSEVPSALDPHGHAVVREGYPAPGDVPLLPERFAGAGWGTLASTDPACGAPGASSAPAGAAP